MARCLVTGGCGFIGSHVVDVLISEGHQVTIVDNLSTGTLANRNRRARLEIIDVQDLDNIIELGPCEYVFHLAALARIQPSIEDPIISNSVNLNGTLHILEYCRKNKAKIIFSSSSSIYEGSKLPTSETDEIKPKNPYALQKWLSEQYIRLYGELYNLDYTILRYFNVYGERQILSGAYAAVVGIFLDQKQNDEELTITGNGRQSRDFTYVKDVARANLLAMNWPRSSFNIGTGEGFSINKIAEFVGGDTRHVEKREGEVQRTLADNTRALELGWQPTVKIKEWVDAIVS